MQKVLFVSLFSVVIKVYVFADYATEDNPQNCTVGESVGTCVPLPECEQIVALLRDFDTARNALTLTRQRKCGFASLNMMICCLENEMKVNATSRFGNNETAGGDITEDALSGTYVERLDQSPVCGWVLLPIRDTYCPQRPNSYHPLASAVAGGRPTKPGNAPWMALLGYSPSPTFLECGGSIITKRHILTAAHCINDRLLLVRVGELNLASDADGAAPVDYLIKRKIAHEDFDRNAYVNDIGILLLEQDITYTNLVKPICLPNPSEQPDVGALVSIAGWGRVSHFGNQSNQLLYANINIFETSLCQQQYRNYPNVVIDDRAICAGDLDGVKDSCKGDSGGPLMIKMCGPAYSWHYTQVGVVSYGLECARAGFPGVYTRVAHYMPWIREKTIGKSN